jgi:fluoroquinolone resistance protein
MIICDQTFAGTPFSGDRFVTADYENCVFKGVDFTETDLSNAKFIDCTFESCNLSMVKVSRTSFQDVKFRDCKVLGLRFDHCNEFNLSFRFDTCKLDHSSFFNKKIRKTVFLNCVLHDVDFTECDLSGATFDGCDLLNANFEHAIVEKADFRTAFNYSIDPQSVRIKKARFSIDGVRGLLDRYDILID